MPRVPVVVLAAALAVSPALAQPSSEPYPIPNAPNIVEESARRIVEGIRRLLDRMPVYEAPRFTPEGDIILKRIPPPVLDGEEAKSIDSHDGVDL